MQVTIKWNQGEKVVDVSPVESDFYEEVGKTLLDISIPNYLSVSCPYGDASYKIIKRGTYIKDGVKLPSMYVTENYNRIMGLAPSHYPEAYLTCINPESNNYKFYYLKPRAYGIEATYGRIGSERGEAFGVKDLKEPYPLHLYWIRYYEKLSKGYKNQSDVYLDSPVHKGSDPSDDHKKQSLSTISAKLYQQLKAFAKHVVRKTFVNEKVTEKQIEKSKEILNKMRQIITDHKADKTSDIHETLNSFNKAYEDLLTLSPRKVRDIRTIFATSLNQCIKIIVDEEDLITMMEGVVHTSKKSEEEESFDSLGIEVYEATDEQKEKVIAKLSDKLKPKVKTVYRVINKEQKKRFDQYLKKHSIKTVKELWHGSKNENWLSIIIQGLKLNPNATITGKMFGQGIYFAPSSMKSWNYTSYYGSYWANGSSDTGFMGVYATAYGDPLDVSTSGQYNQAKLNAVHKNCVHAHAGTQLLNDEIIYYDEDAVLLNYIVEFA